MHRQAIICALWLTGCAERGPPVAVAAPPVPPDLLAPVQATCPPVVTEGDVAACLIRLHGGLRRANAQLEAIGAILAVR